MIKKLLQRDFVRFCLVGGSGFVLNLGILTLLFKSLGITLFIAQLIAAEISLFSNFLLHHLWTYKDRNVPKTIKRLVVQFHATSWVAIIGSAVLVSAGVHLLSLNYMVALVVSSTIALFWNYVWSKYVIWKHHAEVEKTS